MVDPDNIHALFERFILIGGPIAVVALAWWFADNRSEFAVYLVVGFAITGAAWARFRFWTG